MCRGGWIRGCGCNVQWRINTTTYKGHITVVYGVSWGGSGKVTLPSDSRRYPCGIRRDRTTHTEEGGGQQGSPGAQYIREEARPIRSARVLVSQMVCANSNCPTTGVFSSPSVLASGRSLVCVCGEGGGRTILKREARMGPWPPAVA